MPLNVLQGNPYVRAAFQQLFNTYDTYELGALRSLVMRTAVLQLLLAVIELSEHVAPLKKHDVMAELISEIQASPQEERDIGDLAQDAGLSKSLFISRFKQVTGLPPYAYILRCKMVKAKDLLQSEQMTITDIAYELGFSSSQHFAMQFKRQFGITPSQWISTLASNAVSCRQTVCRP